MDFFVPKMSNEPTPENQPEEGHEDYQEEFIHEGEILEELALDDHHEDLESQSDEEMQTDEQVAQQAEVENQEIPDDSVQGFYEHKGDFL